MNPSSLAKSGICEKYGPFLSQHGLFPHEDVHRCLYRPQDDPSPLEWIFYFGFWVMAAIIFAVKLRRGTLIHAESRKQRLDRERAASMTPLLCEQCGKQTTPTESEATPSEV